MPTKKSASSNALPTSKVETDNTGISTKRVSELVKEVANKSLILKPPFQRRLVWTNVVKDHFLETVMLGLPFPEIFIATGDIDTTTMDRTNLLVDGQQRISTLCQYVNGDSDLSLSKVAPYAELDPKQKGKFLDYKVAVRDLGTVTPQQVKEIFSRINSTDYALKAIERLNAQFSGEYKQYCETMSSHDFFNRHDTFSMADLRRMRDLDFCVIITTTLLSTYYHRDVLNRDYLQRFNDKFPKAAKVTAQLDTVFAFIDKCNFDKKCRVWKKTDLFTLIIELSVYLKKKSLDPKKVKETLEAFYSQVDEMFSLKVPDEELEAKAPSKDVFRYLKAATKATNDKYARVDRAQVIDSLLDTTLEQTKKPAKKKVAKKK